MAHINVKIVFKAGGIPRSEKLVANPCPFCKNDGQLDVVEVDKPLPAIWDHLITPQWVVVCPECHAHGPIEVSVEKAITSWNVRRGEI